MRWRKRYDSPTNSRICLEIREKDIGFVIVTYRRNFLSLYFEANPGFQKVTTCDQGKIKIFHVEEIKPLDGFDTMIGSSTVAFLENVKQAKPGKFEALRNVLPELEKIMGKYQSEYACFDLYTVY